MSYHKRISEEQLDGNSGCEDKKSASVSFDPANSDMNVHERPPTNSTPVPKRTKNEIDTESTTDPHPALAHSNRSCGTSTAIRNTIDPHSVVSYPNYVPIPSKNTIESLYKVSVEQEEKSSQNPEEEKVEIASTKRGNDCEQVYLNPCGVLSFTDVLLPALGMEEETAVKKVQSKVQRDSPDYTFVMNQCRRLIRQSVGNAMNAVSDASQKRNDTQMERRKHEVLRKRAALISEHQMKRNKQKEDVAEGRRQHEQACAERKVQMVRQHPRNQDFWKEVVFLTSSMAQLEKEERMWSQMEQNVSHFKKNGALSNSVDKENQTESRQNVKQLMAPMDQLAIATQQKVKDISLASRRIQEGLGDVLTLLDETELVRKQIYKKYYDDYYFDGYTAVQNPKGMIKFLSQSQDDYS